MLLHADVDSFFASVEARDDPRLRGRAFVVGEQVVACASYPARAAGITAGMPLGRVRARWPDVAVVPVRAEVYAESSDAVFALFREVTPLVEPGSMEEGFLDVTARAADVEQAAAVATRLRARCRAEVGLPVSIGVGSTKLMAKIASRRAKPDGLHVIAPADEPALRAGLRLEELWGVGPRTRSRLHDAGLHDLPAIARVGRDDLEALLGRHMGRLLDAIAHGREPSDVRLPRPRLSVSRTRTISPPSRQRSRVEAVLSECVGRLVGEVEAEGRRPTRLDLLLRYDDGTDVVVHDPVGPDAYAAGTVDGRLRALLAATAYEEDGRGVAIVGAAAHLPRA